MGKGNHKAGKVAKTVTVTNKKGTTFQKTVYVKPETTKTITKDTLVAEPEVSALVPNWYSVKALSTDKTRGHTLLPQDIDIPELYETDSIPTDDKIAQVKYFAGAATWYVFELDSDSGDAFGHADLGLGHPELGYFNINELAETNLGFGTVVERDLHFKPTTFAHRDGQPPKLSAKETGDVRDLEEGELVIIQVSPCCQSSMKGVEYGDHMACRSCYQTDLEWEDYLAPFRRDYDHELSDGKVIKNTGPVFAEAKPVSDEDDLDDYFYWG